MSIYTCPIHSLHIFICVNKISGHQKTIYCLSLTYHIISLSYFLLSYHMWPSISNSLIISQVTPCLFLTCPILSYHKVIRYLLHMPLLKPPMLIHYLYFIISQPYMSHHTYSCLAIYLIIHVHHTSYHHNTSHTCLFIACLITSYALPYLILYRS